MIDLDISAKHLEQLQKDCALLNIDLARLTWSSTTDGRFCVKHDMPLVDIRDFLLEDLEASDGFTVTGTSLRVQVVGHWVARAIQLAERKKLRLGRRCLDTAAIISQPIDARELADFREDVRRRKRVDDLQRQLIAARAAKADRAAAKQELADMKEKYGVTPAKAKAPGKAPGTVPPDVPVVPRVPVARKAKQQPLFSLEVDSHVQQ